ncbi:hypothetical protein RirG_264420 [Rhizophagus irregularis DAOM 197198w]|uniref:BED-type domain-containing protein n=1 Tax=Rhizophagus irregularis (strain DAOM 197198w) TaxID=1432141 RepID=A0A015JVK3_RHIIW|nr:hypothetical protein RirG_264420 [Rhizophagus irregularis DAOM 197198w]
MSDSLGESAGSSTRTYSSVWSHFTLVENDEKAQCNYCGTTYKRTGGNTTNLHKHMQKKHSSKIETEVESGEMDKFVKKELPNAPGRLSFTLDAWTSPSYIPFLGITVHWISREWELKEILIDFCKLSGPHSGENLHESFVKCCDDMRILTKIIACTTDNASNNDTLMKALEKTCKDQNIEFTAHNNHIRCLAHIINLAAQDALTTLKVKYVDNENELLNNDEVSEVVPKLRKLVVKIHASPQRREKFSRQCEAAHLPDKELVVDVKTRWNSTFDMIERSLELREALDNIAIADRDLRQCELIDAEWDLLKQIKKLLYIFLRATLHISHGRYPTIENSIPIFNWIMDKIEDFDKEANIDEIVKKAACNAMEKLKKYYQYTDGIIYTISTILDLRLKLTYYKDHNWKEEYITKARDDIRKLYDSTYAPRIDQNIQDEDLIADDDLLSHIYKKWRTSRNESELDLYLGSPIVPGEVDLLQWWKMNESQYPHLAAMARDYLAIPATSTPIEKAFSGGTDLISQKRCSLSAETIRACMCIKSWWKTELKCNK